MQNKQKVCWSVQDYNEMSFRLFSTKKMAEIYIMREYGKKADKDGWVGGIDDPDAILCKNLYW